MHRYREPAEHYVREITFMVKLRCFADDSRVDNCKIANLIVSGELLSAGCDDNLGRISRWVFARNSRSYPRILNSLMISIQIIIIGPAWSLLYRKHPCNSAG